MRMILAATAAFLAAILAWPSAQAWLIQGTTATVSPDAILLGSSAASTISTYSADGTAATNTNAEVPIPFGGTVGKNLQVYLSVDPGSGNSRTFDVADGTTGLGFTCVVTGSSGGTNQTCSDTSHTATVAAGDLIGLKQTATSGTPAAATVVWSVSVTGGGNGLYVGGSSTGANSTSANTYFQWTLATSANEANVKTPMPFAGTLKNLYQHIATAPVSGTWNFAARNEAADTTLLCTISSGNTCNDTSDHPTFTETQRINTDSEPTVTPSGATVVDFGMEVDSANSAQTIIIGATSSTATLANNATNYMGIAHTNATEALVEFPVPIAGTITNLNVGVGVGPGAAKTWAMTLDKNGVASSVTCTISNPNSQCEDSFGSTGHSVSVSAGDLIDISAAPSGTPTATLATFSFILTHS